MDMLGGIARGEEFSKAEIRQVLDHLLSATTLDYDYWKRKQEEEAR